MTEHDEDERFEQPQPGEAGHRSEEGKEHQVEPEARDREDSDSGSGEVAQESKHSYPTSDPPANY